MVEGDIGDAGIGCPLKAFNSGSVADNRNYTGIQGAIGAGIDK